MAKSTHPTAASLDRSHASLLDELPRLEQLLGRDAWVQDLSAELKGLRGLVLDHFRSEEQGGYMETIRQENPRLEHRVAHLAQEHGSLSDSLEEILGTAAEVLRKEQDLRTQVANWILKLRDHETREIDLVQDAFNQDIGNKD